MMFMASSRDGNDSRQKILAAVREDPGLNTSLLAQRVGLSWHTTIYHVLVLQRRHQVETELAGRERRVFPAGIPDLHRGWLAVLRNPNAADVLRLMLHGERHSIPELSLRSGRSHKVIRRQIANLVSAGLVQRHGKMRPEYALATPDSEVEPWLRRAGEGGDDLTRPER
jgi:predicted transcriptional regulator